MVTGVRAAQHVDCQVVALEARLPVVASHEFCFAPWVARLAVGFIQRLVLGDEVRAIRLTGADPCHVPFRGVELETDTRAPILVSPVALISCKMPLAVVVIVVDAEGSSTLSFG